MRSPKSQLWLKTNALLKNPYKDSTIYNVVANKHKQKYVCSEHDYLLQPSSNLYLALKFYCGGGAGGALSPKVMPLLNSETWYWMVSSRVQNLMLVIFGIYVTLNSFSLKNCACTFLGNTFDDIAINLGNYNGNIKYICLRRANSLMFKNICSRGMYKCSVVFNVDNWNWKVFTYKCS